MLLKKLRLMSCLYKISSLKILWLIWKISWWLAWLNIKLKFQNWRNNFSIIRVKFYKLTSLKKQSVFTKKSMSKFHFNCRDFLRGKNKGISLWKSLMRKIMQIKSCMKRLNSWYRKIIKCNKMRFTWKWSCRKNRWDLDSYKDK